MPTTLEHVTISLLPEGRHPAWLAITPDHTRIVVPNQDTHNASIIDIASRSVTAVVKLRPGGVPWAAAITPDSTTAWVTNSQFDGTVQASPRAASVVSVINLENSTVVDEVSVGTGPNGIRVDHQGRYVYVANSRSDTVTQIDSRTHDVIREIRVGHAPADLCLDPSDKFLLVTNFADASLSVIDVESGDVLRTVRTGTAGLDTPNPEWGPGDTFCVAATSDGVAYATNWRTHTVVAMRIADGKILARLSVVDHPCGIEVGPDGRHVFISSVVGLSVVAFDQEELRHTGVLPNLRTSPSHKSQADQDFMSSVSMWGPDTDIDAVRGIVPVHDGESAASTMSSGGVTPIPALLL